jgi:hypothetical protein
LLHAGDPAVVLDAKVEVPTLGVGKAHRGQHDVAVGQALAVALELDRKGLDRRDGVGRIARHG